MNPNETTPLNESIITITDHPSSTTSPRSSELNTVATNEEECSVPSALWKGVIVSTCTAFMEGMFMNAKYALSPSNWPVVIGVPIFFGFAAMALEWCSNGGRCKPEHERWSERSATGANQLADNNASSSVATTSLLLF